MTLKHQPVFPKPIVPRSLLFMMLAVLLPMASAWALDPDKPANSYMRTRFGQREGLRGNVVSGIVQSKDGFLWLIVSGGLVRFDGQHFKGFELPKNVHSLAVAPNGDLWVGTGEDLEQIPAAALNQFSLPAISYPTTFGSNPTIQCLHFSQQGVLWIGTSTGLYRFEAGAFSPVVLQTGIERIEEPSNGNLLITTTGGEFVELNEGKVVPHPDLPRRLNLGPEGVFHVLEDSHGIVWFCTKQGVARLVRGVVEKLPGYGRPGNSAIRAYEDPNGNIWIAGASGLFRAKGTDLEVAAGDLDVRYTYADQEGDMWVGTNGAGLFRFKDRAARMFTTADGLPNNIAMTVLAARDGIVWSGLNCGGLSRFDGRRFQTFNEKNGLRNSCVWSLAEDPNGDLWIGTWGGGLFRFHDGRFTQYGKEQGLERCNTRRRCDARRGSVVCDAFRGWSHPEWTCSQLQRG